MEPIKQVLDSDPVKKVYSFWDEFRQFAFKGNVVNLAIGVVIGAAFSKLIDSLVKNLIMPVVAVVLPGDQSYTKWTVTLNGKAIPYGEFLGELVNFLLLALLLFVFVVKFLGWLMQAKQAETLPPTRQEELLTEIRDLLRTSAGEGGGAVPPPKPGSGA